LALGPRRRARGPGLDWCGAPGGRRSETGRGLGAPARARCGPMAWGPRLPCTCAEPAPGQLARAVGSPIGGTRPFKAWQRPGTPHGSTWGRDAPRAPLVVVVAGEQDSRGLPAPSGRPQHDSPAARAARQRAGQPGLSGAHTSAMPRPPCPPVRADAWAGPRGREGRCPFSPRNAAPSASARRSFVLPPARRVMSPMETHRGHRRWCAGFVERWSLPYP
jgi:hypothetical protein